MDEELDSIFDEVPEEAAQDPVLPGGGELAQQVAAFLPLDRRRVSGNPPLAPAEEGRLRELREWFEYQFGAGNPPLGGSQRSALRVPARHKVAISGARSGDGQLANLSSAGAFVATDAAADPGTRLDLAIARGAGAPITVAAEVRWMREIGNMDGPAGLGIVFRDVDDDTFFALEEEVHRVLEALAREGA